MNDRSSFISIGIATVLLLICASQGISAAKPGLDHNPSLIFKLQQGIDEHNKALEKLITGFQTRHDYQTSHKPNLELLNRLKRVPGVRSSMFSMIEDYQRSGSLLAAQVSVDTISNLFDELKGQIAKEHRERLTSIAMERITQQKRAALSTKIDSGPTAI